MKLFAANKFVTGVLLLGFYFNAVNAQPETKPDKPKTPFRERLFTGGNIGLQFGSVTLIDVSPKLGYKLTEKLAAGIGATYIYINDKRIKGYEYHTNIYGGRLFGQYQAFENVLAYSEFEILSLETLDDFTYQLKRRNVPSFLAGGGYTQHIGESSSAVILVLWDLIDSKYSIYQNPIIRIGFNIGF